MVVSGKATVEGHALTERDAIGVSGVDAVEVTMGTEGAELLLIDVPMHID